MKRKFLAFVLLITAGLSLSSCLSSDDDTNIEYSHDTAITAFSLGNLGQYVKRNTTGKMDSLVASAVTGTNYTFTLVVLIGLVIIFKSQLTSLVQTIFEKITSESSGI